MGSRRDFIGQSAAGLAAATLSTLGLKRYDAPAGSTEAPAPAADEDSPVWVPALDGTVPHPHHDGSLVLEVKGEPARPLHFFHAKIGVGRSIIDLYGYPCHETTRIFDVPVMAPEAWVAMLDGKRMKEFPTWRPPGGYRAFTAPFGHRLESIVFAFRADDHEKRSEDGPTVDVLFAKLVTIDECGLSRRMKKWRTEYTADQLSTWIWPVNSQAVVQTVPQTLFDFDLPMSFVALYAGTLNIPFPITIAPSTIKTSEFSRSVFVGDTPQELLPAITKDATVSFVHG